MEIEIRNFGPIDSIKFDLNKDLHLIYGKNAIGKSYATYCLYCLVKNIKNKNFRNVYFYKTDENILKKFLTIKLKNLKNNSAVDSTKDYEKLVNNVLKDLILKGLQNSLYNTFSSLKNLKNRYTNKNYEMILTISTTEQLKIYSDDDGYLDLQYQDGQETIELRQKETKATKYSFYVNNHIVFGKSTEDTFQSAFTKHISFKINNILKKLDFNIKDIYFLPASRSGLYQALNAFTPILAELTQNRFFMQQNKNIELPSLSEPVADYFLDLSTLDKKNINTKYEGIIKLLQTDILRGNVEYNEETKKILYKPNDIDLELNLSEASSMVAELSPLVLYFKHILNNKYYSTRERDFYYSDDDELYNEIKKEKGFDILFIEEPEAHLHPEVQVKLMEIFAKLTKLGLKIFITSHSDYMFNKINNLIITKEFKKSSLMVYHLVKKEDGTTINQNMNVDDDWINDDNFQEVSEQLYNERLNYLEHVENK